MFVSRREDGSIYGTWTVRQSPEQEELADDHADVVAFAARMTNPVPGVVTPAQLRLALDAVDMLDTVEAMVDSLGKAARIKWDFGITVPRNDPLVIAAAQQLNWTAAQVDDLFRAAAQL